MARTEFSSTIAVAPRTRPTEAAGLLSRLWDHYRGWQARRETLRALYSLDSATLRDLGISPRGIESLVYSSGGDTMRAYDPDWWRV